MHTGPSEAALMRSLCERETREHEATKLQLQKLQELAARTVQWCANNGLTGGCAAELRALLDEQKVTQ